MNYSELIQLYFDRSTRTPGISTFWSSAVPLAFSLLAEAARRCDDSARLLFCLRFPTNSAR